MKLIPYSNKILYTWCLALVCGGSYDNKLFASAQQGNSPSCLHTFNEQDCTSNDNSCLWCNIQGFGNICLPQDDGQSVQGSPTILGVSCTAGTAPASGSTTPDTGGNSGGPSGPSSASAENAVAIAPESNNNQQVVATPPSNTNPAAGNPTIPLPQVPPAPAPQPAQPAPLPAVPAPAQPAPQQPPPADTISNSDYATGPIMRNENGKPYFTKRTRQNSSVNIYSCIGGTGAQGTCCVRASDWDNVQFCNSGSSSAASAAASACPSGTLSCQTGQLLGCKAETCAVQCDTHCSVMPLKNPPGYNNNVVARPESNNPSPPAAAAADVAVVTPPPPAQAQQQQPQTPPAAVEVPAAAADVAVVSPPPAAQQQEPQTPPAAVGVPAAGGNQYEQAGSQWGQEQQQPQQPAVGEAAVVQPPPPVAVNNNNNGPPLPSMPSYANSASGKVSIIRQGEQPAPAVNTPPAQGVASNVGWGGGGQSQGKNGGSSNKSKKKSKKGMMRR